MQYTAVTPVEFASLEGVAEWRYALGAIHAEFALPSFPAGAALVAAIADAAEAADHHPDVALRYPGVVRVDLTTHATGGLTTLDVDLARAISELAAEAGAAPSPTAAQSVEITIDALDIEACLPFWAAVMGGYRRTGERTLVDPLRCGPALCFQRMAEPRPERNRIHVDVSVPHDVAEQRVAEALAAGGLLVSDARARSWWVLADPEGNEACVCTWQDR